MKIGILTYHRSHNYGALLQAIALRKVLSDMGHQVTYIDYWPDYHKRMYANFSMVTLGKKKGVKAKIEYVKSCLIPYKYRKKRKEIFSQFIIQHIEPHVSTMQETYDVVVYGSDQIWRKQKELKTYNPVYFGRNHIPTHKSISYAASMGILPQNEKDKDLIKKYLSSLDCISVREKSLLDLVHSLGYKDACLDLDPTLLLASSFWEDTFHLSRKNERYALYYCLKDSFDVNELRRYTHSKGMKLKIIYSKAICKNTEDKYTTSGPEDFLNLVYGADFVFTTSFHGLAFALIFQKPFYASYRKNSDRAATLLELLGLSNRMLPIRSAIPEDNSPIDYEKVNRILREMRDKSLSHLTKMIQ